MENSKKVDDIVAMIDQFMANGGGHMDVNVQDTSEDLEKQVVTRKSNECSGRDMACMVPTLHEGLDREE